MISGLVRCFQLSIIERLKWDGKLPYHASQPASRHRHNLLIQIRKQTMTSTHKEKRAARILYVEDELIVRSTMHKMLQSRYSTIYLADNGKEGLELFRTHRPDVVITDARMPGMDGLAMSKAIRAE